MANNCYSKDSSITNYSIAKDGEFILFENVRRGPTTDEISEQSKAYLDDSYARLSEAISALSNLNYESCFGLKPDVVDTDILCMPSDEQDLSLKELMRIRSKKVDVFDVSGAGDTFVATFVYCISNKIDVVKSLKVANNCATHIVTLRGTQPIKKDKLLNIIKTTT